MDINLLPLYLYASILVVYSYEYEPRPLYPGAPLFTYLP